VIGQIVLILVVGSLNLVLGYVIAVRLGYGPRSLHETWEAISGNGRSSTIDPAVNAIIQQMVAEPTVPVVSAPSDAAAGPL